MVEEIKINSEKFHNVKFRANQITEWLQIILDISGEDQLDVAIKRCALRVLDEGQAKALVMTRELMCQEASGNITPQIQLYKTYHNIATSTGGLEILERRKGIDRRTAEDRRVAV